MLTRSWRCRRALFYSSSTFFSSLFSSERALLCRSRETYSFWRSFICSWSLRLTWICWVQVWACKSFSFWSSATRPLLSALRYSISAFSSFSLTFRWDNRGRIRPSKAFPCDKECLGKVRRRKARSLLRQKRVFSCT